MTPNPYRAEVEINIFGKSLIMRGDWNTICSLEAHTGKTLQRILSDSFTQKQFPLTAKESAFIVQQGLLASGKEYSLEKIGNQMMGKFDVYQKVVLEFLAECYKEVEEDGEDIDEDEDGEALGNLENQS